MNKFYFEIPQIKITKELQNLHNTSSDLSWNHYSGRLFNRHFIPGQNPKCVNEVYTQFKDISLLGRAALLLVKPGGIVTPHIDAYRRAAINIPLSSNWNQCNTIFYTAKGWRKLVKIPNIYRQPGKLPKWNPGGGYPFAEEVERVQYSKALCINNSEIHGVINESTEDRYVLSISIKPPHTFEEIKEMYLRGHLI